MPKKIASSHSESGEASSQDEEASKELSDRPYIPHAGEGRQYMRDIIMGVNDGLVSMFLLVLGVAGGGMTAKAILLTGIAGAIAGAISMALGEYMATKSQKEVYEGDIELERSVHFKYFREEELQQVRDTFILLEVKGDLLEEAVSAIDAEDAHLLQFMKVFEFGMNEEDERSPITAMLKSGMYFIVGSLPSWVPFLFIVIFDGEIRDGVITAAVLASAFLFTVGALKTYAVRGNWLLGGFENFIISAVGAGLSFLAGYIYQVVRNE